MTHDRNYWRASETRALIDAARDSSDELAIALGERLDDMVAAHLHLAALEREHAELMREHADLQLQHASARTTALLMAGIIGE